MTFQNGYPPPPPSDKKRRFPAWRGMDVAGIILSVGIVALVLFTVAIGFFYGLVPMLIAAGVVSGVGSFLSSLCLGGYYGRILVDLLDSCGVGLAGGVLLAGPCAAVAGGLGVMLGNGFLDGLVAGGYAYVVTATACIVGYVASTLFAFLTEPLRSRRR